MSDWTGTGSSIPAAVSVAAPCLEYLTVAAVRAEFGDDVADDTDATIQRRIDQLSALLEDELGHTFGRTLIVSSSTNDTVEVTATALVLSGVSYTFAAYPTLQQLVTAANATCDVELLPYVRGDTPSTYLKLHGAAVCGPAYEQRVILCSSYRYECLSGQNESHLFLSLPLASVATVVEDAVILTSADYWAILGDSWLVRKYCSCVCSCGHPKGRWPATYPGNIAVKYVPTIWGHVPSALRGVLLDAFSAKAGLAPFQSEDFGDYSYKRPAAPVTGWQDILGSGTLRKYAVRFQP